MCKIKDYIIDNPNEIISSSEPKENPFEVEKEKELKNKR